MRWMRHWKRWLTLSGLALVVIATAFIWAVWNSLSSEWRIEASAAQYALNHSPMQQLTSYSVFTGAGAQEVFTGKDGFGRKWVAFVYGPPYAVKSVPSTGMWSATRLTKSLKLQHITPVHLNLGYFNAAARESFHTAADVVWECYVRLPSGLLAYIYYDAYSGQQIATYILAPSSFSQLTQNFG
ncbi:hypothetical protein D2Q93_06085 [Alicyclobacillaceae bacterium I2511]|nr:hypothetical protein D2Q93_06085 [Alicyclobacillaceae bacterium I2511]